MEGDLVTCRIAQRFCNPKKNPRRGFSWAGSGNVIVSCRKIASHGGRVSNMQNCAAILQSQEKSTEGFFLGRLRERNCFLPKSNKRMDARLSNMQKPLASAIPKKIHGRIFLGRTPDWKGGVARPPEAGRSASGALESG